VRGSGAVVCSWSLLIRWAQRARHQAETPPIPLSKFPGPALTRLTAHERRLAFIEVVIGYAAAELMPKVAAVETNHVFGEIHFSACEELR
jgi:hypothetical protein